MKARVGIEYFPQVIDSLTIIVYAFDAIPQHRTQARHEPPSGAGIALYTSTCIDMQALIYLSGEVEKVCATAGAAPDETAGVSRFQPG